MQVIPSGVPHCVSEAFLCCTLLIYVPSLVLTEAVSSCAEQIGLSRKSDRSGVENAVTFQNATLCTERVVEIHQVDNSTENDIHTCAFASSMTVKMGHCSEYFLNYIYKNNLTEK